MSFFVNRLEVKLAAGWMKRLKDRILFHQPLRKMAACIKGPLSMDIRSCQHLPTVSCRRTERPTINPTRNLCLQPSFRTACQLTLPSEDHTGTTGNHEILSILPEIWTLNGLLSTISQLSVAISFCKKSILFLTSNAFWVRFIRINPLVYLMSVL